MSKKSRPGPRRRARIDAGAHLVAAAIRAPECAACGWPFVVGEDKKVPTKYAADGRVIDAIALCFPCHRILVGLMAGRDMECVS